MRVPAARSLVRWVGRLAVLSFVLAVLLGRYVEPESEFRRLGEIRFVSIHRNQLIDESRETRFIDLSSGEMTTLLMPENESLDRAGLAPWCDERGRTQAVGRWIATQGEGIKRINDAMGLARVRLPDGLVLDRVPTSIVPNGAPCWMPGTEARVLFAARDGRLYRLFFEDGNQNNGEFLARERDRVPQALDWRVPGLSVSELRFFDVTRPHDGRLAASGLFLATASRGSTASPESPFGPPQPWWLRLDRTGTAIVAAGPLIQPGSELESAIQYRYPTLITNASGGLVLVYLNRGHDQEDWRLWASPIELDPVRLVPRPLKAPGRILAENCDASPLGASPDGRWVYGVLRAEGERHEQTVVRLPIESDDGGTQPFGLVNAGRPPSRSTHNQHQ